MLQHTQSIAQMSTASSFSRLPEELWSGILGNFDRKLNAQSIHALRLTSKQFCRLAEPLIYRAVIVPSWEEGSLEKNGSFGPLRRVAMSIALYPQRARFVREIRLLTRSSKASEASKTPSPERYNASLWSKRFQAFLQDRCDLPDGIQHELLQQLQQEAPSGFAGFILSVCPGIETLEIRGNGIGQLLQKITFHAATTTGLSPTLESLREISIGANMYEFGLSTIIPFLGLKSLRHVNFHGLGDTSSWWIHTLPPAIPKNDQLRPRPRLSFRLDSCVLSGPGLSWLLSSCKSANSLTVRWRAGLWTEEMTNQDLGDAIRQEGENLEHLLLDTTDTYAFRPQSQSRSFGSFKELKNLKYLALPESAFDGFDADSISQIIPSQLEHFVILGVKNEHLLAYKAIENEVRRQIPGLEKMTCVPLYGYTIEEWFGPVQHQAVDYNQFEGPHGFLRM